MQIINSFKLVVLFSSLFFVSCEKEGANTEYKEIQVFEKVVKTISINQVDYKFLVKEIRESRCPIGVNCIRAGEAIVVFDFEAGSKKYTDLQLCLGCDSNIKIPQSTKGTNIIDPLVITLNDVLPYPVSSGVISNRYCLFSLD